MFTKIYIIISLNERGTSERNKLWKKCENNKENMIEVENDSAQKQMLLKFPI